MKRLLFVTFTLFAIACGGAVEGKGPGPNEKDGGSPPTVDAEPPPYDEPCGFAGHVNDGESCPSSAKGELCDLFQPECNPYQPPAKCMCNGVKFVCGQPTKCSPTDGGGID